MNKVNIVFLIIAVVVSSIFAGCARAPAPAQKILRVGALMDLTAEAAPWGIPAERSIAMEVEKVNSEGGIEIGGEKYLIEYHMEDSKLSPEAAVISGRELVYRHKVDVIFGPLFNHQTMPILPFTTPEKIPTFVPGLADDILLKETNAHYCFKTQVSPTEMLPEMYRYIFETYAPVERVAELHDSGFSPLYGARLAKQYLEAVGKEVVADEVFEPGTLDFHPYLARVLAQEPDHIDSIATTPPDWALIVKQAREMGYTGSFLYGAVVTPEMIDIIGDENAYALVNAAFVSAYEKGPLGTAESEDFRHRFTEKYGEWDPSALITAPTFWIVMEGYQMAGSLDPDAFVEVLETRVFHPFGIEARFGDVGGYYGVPHQMLFPQYIYDFKRGEPYIAEDITAEEQATLWHVK